MQYLFKFIDKIKEKVKTKRILFFLDYDGTLTPIVERPDKAVISKETKELLRSLVKSPKFKLAIISGRALKDVKRKVSIDGIIYVGNHGLEIEGPKIKFESPISERSKGLIKQIKEDLNKKLSAIKGVFVENKGLTLSLHYRLVDKEDISKVKDIFEKITKAYLIRNRIRTSSGKKVLEVRPPVSWNKGKVCLWLLARQKSIHKDVMPIYIGDDVTDEDAFKAVRNRGLSIFVGKPKKSYAQYYLKNTKEVFDFLRKIYETNKSKRAI